MNFKKLKRMLSIVLSATMILSSNMTGLAAEVSAPVPTESVAEQENLQLDTELRKSTVDEAGIAKYTTDAGDVMYGTSALADGDITLSNSEMNLTLGGQTTGTLTATVVATPGTNPAEYPKVTWSTADANIATVESNAADTDPVTNEQTATVTAVSAGTTTITATIGEDPDTTSVSCTVTVTNAPAAELTISLAPTTLALTENGAAGTLTATVENNTENQEISWSSNAANVATVDADPNNANTAIVTPKAAGTATISATIGNKSATCAVTVAAHVHTYTSQPRVPASCWSTGTRAHYTCTCGAKFLTRGGAPVDENAITIAKLDHHPVVHPAVNEQNCVADHVEYYTCANCSRYYGDLKKFEDGADKQGTSGTKWSEDDTADWYTSADAFKDTTGHLYRDDAGGISDYTFVWNNLDEEHFQNSASNGVTASRTCGKENCNYSEPATSVEVSREPNSNYDCTVGGTFTYTATARFGTGPNASSSTKQITRPIPAREAHDYVPAFNWNGLSAAADENNHLTYNEDGVTAAYTCRVCQKPAADIKVTVALAEDETFNPATDTLSCGEARSIKFVANLYIGDSETPAATETHTASVRASNHALEYVEAKPATCDEEGNEAYFKCQNCNRKFWDGEAEDEVGANEKTSIDALGHNFALPEFSWEDPQTRIGKAQATFRCTRGTCGATVVRRGLDVAEEGRYLGTAPITCGNRVELSYAVSVQFDRLAIRKENDAYIYDTSVVAPGELNEITRTGYVTRQDMLNHSFTLTSTWKDGTDKDNNPENGLTAVIECSTCKHTISFDSSTGEIINKTDNTAIADATGSITVTKVTSGHGYRPVSCVADGTDVYEVVIACDTHESTAEANGMQTRYTVTGYATNTISQTGHSYTASVLPWDYTLDENKLPQGVRVSLVCSECGNTLTGSNESGNGISLNFTPVTTSESDYVAATCTSGGMDAWEVTVQYNGDSLSGNGGSKLYVNKPSEKLGHKYDTENPVWDWSAYGTVDLFNPNQLVLDPNLNEETAKVYATYPCTNPNCDGLQDTTERPSLPGEAVNGRWVRKLEAASVTRGTTEANCVQSGFVTYTAVLDDDETAPSNQRFYVNAAGHKWDSRVTWGDWVLTGETDKKGLPVYSITASISCRNAFCRPDDKVKNLSIKTSETVDTLTEAQKQDSHIEMTVTSTPATCTAAGRTVYEAKSVFMDGTNVIEFTLTPGTDVKTKTDLTPALGHNYTTTWAWKGIVKDGDTEKEVDVTAENESSVIRYTSATATTVCENEKDEDGEYVNPRVETIPVTPSYEDGNSVVTCEQGVIAYYDAVASSGASARKVITLPPSGHNPGWKINVSLDEIDDNTTGVKAVYGCLNELTDDVWNDPEADIRDVTVVKSDETEEPTCMAEGKIVWNLMVGTTVIGTIEEPAGKVKDAHKIAIQWDTLQAADRTADGKVTYTVNGTLTCDFNDKFETSHNENVVLEATANLGTSDCQTHPQGDVEYQLTIKTIGSRNEEATAAYIAANPDLITIVGGNTQSRPYEAGRHSVRRVAAHHSQNCAEENYDAHYRCNICGKTFRNSSASTEVQISLKPQGHQYGTPEFRWIEDGRRVQAVFNCTRSGCPGGNDEEVNEQIGSNSRAFWAEITDNEPYVDVEPRCKDATVDPTDTSRPQGNKGIAYYPVKVDLTNEENTDNFTTLVYDEEVQVILPEVDHHFVEKNGTVQCEWCDLEADNVVKVSFYGRTGNVVEESWIDKSTAAANIIVPVAPNQIGYEFSGWTFNNTTYTDKDALATAIQTALASAENNIRVEAVYTSLSDNVDVVANYICIVNGQQVSVAEAQTETGKSVGENVPVEADAEVTKDDVTYYFSHWSDQASDGKVLATSTSYEVFVNTAENKTVYAIYVTDEGQKEANKPVVALADKYTTTLEDGTTKISFTYTMSNLGLYGYELVDSGILYDTKNGSSVGANTLNLDNPDAKKLVLNGIKTNTLTVKVSDKTKTIATRGYLRYTDGKEVFVVYSDIERESYNSIEGN